MENANDSGGAVTADARRRGAARHSGLGLRQRWSVAQLQPRAGTLLPTCNAFGRPEWRVTRLEDATTVGSQDDGVPREAARLLAGVGGVMPDAQCPLA
eukprot:scaffold699_cov385-Prasinococcus_capsulatus_cf.AAC.6